MTLKKSNDTLNEALAVAAAIAYTKKEVDKLKKDIDSLREENLAEVIQGPQGDPGAQGLRGFIGAKGDKGDRGVQGEPGEKGERGELGAQGPKGEQGSVGDQGLKGEQGDKGDTGDQGERGPQGDKGDRGDQGSKGDKGDRGERGERGLQGIAGKDGADGALGPQGARGEKGDRGQQGPKGDKGDKGNTGDAGSVGPAGPKGDKGEQGDKGDKGDSGKDGDVKPIEDKFEKFVSNVQKDINAFKNKVNASIVKHGSDAFKATGSGEVNLRYLDDVDRDSIQDGYLLSYNEADKKFVFVEGGSGTVDTVARTRATNAWNTANAAFDAANNASPALQIQDEGVAKGIANTLNFIGSGVSVNVSNGIASVTVTATGSGGASESLNIVFPNSSGTTYKLVVLNETAETVPASALELNHANRVVGVLDANNEVVTFGAVTNPSWNWIAEQSLYLGSDGDIATTSTIDGGTFSLKIGYAISSTKVFVKIGTPVLL